MLHDRIVQLETKLATLEERLKLSQAIIERGDKRVIDVWQVERFGDTGGHGDMTWWRSDAEAKRFVELSKEFTPFRLEKGCQVSSHLAIRYACADAHENDSELGLAPTDKFVPLYVRCLREFSKMRNYFGNHS